MARDQQRGHAILAFWGFTLNYRQLGGVEIEEVVIAVVVGVQQRSNKVKRVEHGQRGRAFRLDGRDQGKLRRCTKLISL